MIEALIIGSATFLIVIAAVSAAIRIAAVGAEVQEAARAGAIHAARHDQPAAARSLIEVLYPGVVIDARQTAGGIEVAASVLLDVAHPLGPTRVVINGRARMPLAPFRSDRG